MKKILGALLIATVSSSAWGFISLDGGAYVRLKGGQAYAQPTGVDNGMLYGVQAGVYLAEADKQLGMMVGLANTQKLDYQDNAKQGNYQSTSLYLGSEYTKLLTEDERLAVTGALGLSVSSNKLTTQTDSERNTRLSPYASVGIGYHITKRMHIGLTYEYVNKDIQGAVVGVSRYWR